VPPYLFSLFWASGGLAYSLKSFPSSSRWQKQMAKRATLGNRNSTRVTFVPVDIALETLAFAILAVHCTTA
jgi:hypothetical protein